MWWMFSGLFSNVESLAWCPLYLLSSTVLVRWSEIVQMRASVPGHLIKSPGFLMKCSDWVGRQSHVEQCGSLWLVQPYNVERSDWSVGLIEREEHLSIDCTQPGPSPANTTHSTELRQKTLVGELSGCNFVLWRPQGTFSSLVRNDIYCQYLYLAPTHFPLAIMYWYNLQQVLFFFVFPQGH